MQLLLMLRSLHAVLSIEQYTPGISFGSGSFASSILSSETAVEPIMPLPLLVEGEGIFIDSTSFCILDELHVLAICTGHLLQMQLFRVLLFSGTRISSFFFPKMSNFVTSRNREDLQMIFLKRKIREYVTA